MIVPDQTRSLIKTPEVGAVQLLPANTAPEGFDQVDGEPMSDAGIDKHLQGVVIEPGLGAQEDVNDFRISSLHARRRRCSTVCAVDSRAGSSV